MAGSISDFKASFRKELARPSKFDVFIPIPLGMLPYYNTSRQLSFRCEATSLPGRNISTSPMKVYNVVEMFPYQTTYDKIPLTFIVSDDMAEKKFFDAWLNWINPSTNKNMKYKKDYSVPIVINQYDVQNKLSYSVTLIDAFPTSMNEMSLDWSADGIHKLTINFEYTEWKNNSLEATAMDIIEDGIANILTFTKLDKNATERPEFTDDIRQVNENIG